MSARLAYIYEECRSVSAAVYGSKAPGEVYRDAVAKLLLTTGYHESGGYCYNRQRIGRPAAPASFAKEKYAWGLWQTENISIEESLRQLARRPAVRARAMAWYFGAEPADEGIFARLPRIELLNFIAADLRLALLFARLHYLWVPERVPDTLDAAAKYYKKFYNTAGGAATPEDFMKAWEKVKGLVESEA